MKVHKEKYEKCVEMLRQGYSYRQIAKKLKLSISQINQIAKDLEIMVDLEVNKRKLKELENKINELEEYKAKLEKEIKEKEKLIDEIVEVAKLKKEAIGTLKLFDKAFQSILSNPYIHYLALSDDNFRDLIVKANKIHEAVKKL
ncbi:Trp family transcriptional regulator [Archaeoglobus profundus]|uniref:Resolvase helix-turn-helix domain protein n=1 Tax=Archaeoglobus profundus (strain DSM 5631 / JCM 9629 / NBRC 100127 / Av18) TaxID=572546 RepID=D2RGU4_ARCPA|nr:Trp family transcriptional regulator [Archaeoglobus profundus]ADB57519.1 hypothetical protein Arcpr_0453 [Archaeoglobus profundus DSM 5631]